MIRVEIFISCGAEVEKFRDIGNGVLRLLDHMFANEMDQEVAVRTWDFRNDAPRVVQAGELAARSLTMVGRSQGLVAIFGEEVPEITQKEIQEAFELRRHGREVSVWIFLDPEKKAAKLEEFLESIRNDFGEEVIYGHYRTDLEFQSALFNALTPYVFRKLGVAVQPPVRGG